MRLMYLDPGLHNDIGHHATYARAIVGEARRRGMAVDVFGWQGLTASLQTELLAVPLFRFYTYRRGFEDNAISGWLLNFDDGWRTLLEDLRQLSSRVGPADVVFAPSLWPAGLMALAQWLSAMPAERRPRVVGEFASECGLRPAPRQAGAAQFAVPDPRLEPRATLYHYASSLIEPAIAQRLTLATFEPVISEMYQTLLGRSVQSLPWPIAAPPTTRRRGDRSALTVSFLGYQRADKGYHLVPAIVQQLLRERSAKRRGVRVLIHNSRPTELADVQAEVEKLASDIVRIDRSPADGPGWQALLDESDLVVCPYDPARYATAHSGLTSECLANGIPLIVPAGTVLSDVADRAGVGMTFADHAAGAVVAATVKAIERFDAVADRSAQAAAQWRLAHGPGKFMDALLTACAAPR